jgi:hypothetical protein
MRRVLVCACWGLFVCILLYNDPLACGKAQAAEVSTDAPQSGDGALFKPELTYRAVAFGQRFESVYHNDEEHRDWADQIYLTLFAERQAGYANKIVVEPAIRTIRNRPKDIETVIDQAYLIMAFGKNLDLTAGKKTELEGSGFLVNPSDLINGNRDLFDPLYQKEGRVFTRLGVRFGEDSYVGFGILPQRARNFEESRFFAVLASELLGVDARFNYLTHQTEKSSFGLSLSRFFYETVELHFDGRYDSRKPSETDINKNLREQPFVDREFDEGALYAAVGTRIAVTARRSLIGEYIVNQGGLDKNEMPSFLQSEGFSDAEQTIARKGDSVLDPDARLKGKQYAFVAVKDEESIDKTEMAASIVTNLLDNSSFVALHMRHQVSEIAAIELTPTFFPGAKFTEFGETPFHRTTYLSLKGRF